MHPGDKRIDMIDEPRLPMGKVINTHLGKIEMDEEIIQLGFFDDHIEITCIDGKVYKAYKDEKGDLIIETKLL